MNKRNKSANSFKKGRRKQNERKRRGHIEFSKIVLSSVMIIYAITVIFSFIVVGANNELLPELLTFIGAPTSVAIGFYAWKAKAENIRKIDKSAYKKFVTKEDDDVDGN